MRQTTEVGWAWTLINGSGVRSKRILDPGGHVHVNLRELHVEGRHLVCRGKLSITLTFEELSRLYKGSHGDNLMDAIFICKMTLIQAHEPCPLLQSKVMVYNREEAQWRKLNSSSGTPTNSAESSSTN